MSLIHSQQPRKPTEPDLKWFRRDLSVELEAASVGASEAVSVKESVVASVEASVEESEVASSNLP